MSDSVTRGFFVEDGGNVRGVLRRVLPTRFKQILWRVVAGTNWVAFWSVVQPLRKGIYGSRSVVPHWMEWVTLHYLFTRSPDRSASSGSRQMNHLLSLPVDHDGLLIQFRSRAWQYAVNAAELETLEDRIMHIRNG